MGQFDHSELSTGGLALEQGRAGLVLPEIRKKKVQLDLWHGPTVHRTVYVAHVTCLFSKLRVRDRL